MMQWNKKARLGHSYLHNIAHNARHPYRLNRRIFRLLGGNNAGKRDILYSNKPHYALSFAILDCRYFQSKNQMSPTNVIDNRTLLDNFSSAENKTVFNEVDTVRSDKVKVESIPKSSSSEQTMIEQFSNVDLSVRDAGTIAKQSDEQAALNPMTMPAKLLVTNLEIVPDNIKISHPTKFEKINRLSNSMQKSDLLIHKKPSDSNASSIGSLNSLSFEPQATSKAEDIFYNKKTSRILACREKTTEVARKDDIVSSIAIPDEAIPKSLKTEPKKYFTQQLGELKKESISKNAGHLSNGNDFLKQLGQALEEYNYLEQNQIHQAVHNQAQVSNTVSAKNKQPPRNRAVNSTLHKLLGTDVSHQGISPKLNTLAAAQYVKGSTNNRKNSVEYPKQDDIQKVKRRPRLIKQRARSVDMSVTAAGLSSSLSVFSAAQDYWDRAGLSQLGLRMYR